MSMDFYEGFRETGKEGIEGAGGFQAWLDSLAQPELNPQPAAPVQGMYIPETVLEPERVEPVWEGLEPAVSQELPETESGLWESLSAFIFGEDDREVSPAIQEVPVSLEPMQDPGFLQDLTPEVTEEGLLISGNPQEVAPLLDYAQGDNPYNASGNCGLVSVSNVLEMAGLENCGEDEVTLYALETNQCANDPSLASADRGGTNEQNLENILESYGVAASWCWSDAVSYETLAAEVAEGSGVIVSVNAGYLWDEPEYVNGEGGAVYANHFVTVTGVARNADSGEIEGFYICDSGRGQPEDACRFVSLEQFDLAFGQVEDSGAVITDYPIRQLA